MSAPHEEQRKVALLILRDEGVDWNDAQAQAMFARFVEWTEELSTRGVLHGVEGLMRQGKTVRRKGASLLVDGPYAEGREAVLGFVAVRVADLDEACRLAAESPYAAFGGAIEVRMTSAFPKRAASTAERVSFSNHAAVRVRRSERDRIRKFYCDVLGCKLMRELEDKDDFRIGDDHYIAFLYAAGDGQGADKGVNYAADDALSDDDFLKGIFLELKADDVEKMRDKIVGFGVKVLSVPDPHLYFQAPGGQVFRLVGTNENLSKYEGS